MKRPLCLSCLVFILFTAITQAAAKPSAPPWEQAEGRRILLSGTVYFKECRPDAFTGEKIPVLYLHHISWNQSPFTAKTEGVLCFLRAGEEPPPSGSAVLVRGRLKAWKRATNPGEFDQEQYYRIKKLDFCMTGATVTAWEGGSPVKEALYRLRQSAGERFDEMLTPKDASVMKAMLLGSREELDRDVKALYQSAGVSHILAISGLHISLIGMGLYRLLRRLGLSVKPAALLCMLAAAAYGGMTGMSPSAARAVFMLILQLAALSAGRSCDLPTSLSLAAALLLAKQPLYIKDPAFLLSFGAVAGICLLFPALRKLVPGKLPGPAKAAAEGLACGGSVFFATLPVSINSFYQIPVYAQLLNLLIIPLMSILLPAGILLPVACGAAPPAGRAAAALCHLILGFFEAVCLAAAKLPGSVWTAGHMTGLRIAMFYALLAVFLCLQRRLSMRLNLYWLLAALFLAVRPPDCAGAKITMLDVGQGDCFLIRCGGRNILIDGGSSSSERTGTYQILPVLKYYGIDRLDYIFISHLDADHYNGTKELLAGGVRAGTVFFPYPEDKEEIREQIASYARESRLLKAGDRLEAGGLAILCLHPCLQETFPDTNSTSLVLELRYGDFTMLFTGDMGMAQETSLMEAMRSLPEASREITVLKVAHHGSDGSTSSGLLDYLNPKAALISCAMENSYGHPGRELMERLTEKGIPVYQTRSQGAVTLHVSGGGCRIDAFVQ